MLPPTWQTISLFNPIVYLVSGMRWAFYENADVSIASSLGATVGFLVVCLATVHWIFATGYKLRV
jgi:ABC-2 type transport system permease protein